MSQQSMGGFWIYFTTNLSRYVLQCQPSKATPGRFEVVQLLKLKADHWQPTNAKQGMETNGVEVGQILLVSGGDGIVAFGKVVSIEKVTCACAES